MSWNVSLEFGGCIRAVSGWCFRGLIECSTVIEEVIMNAPRTLVVSQQCATLTEIFESGLLQFGESRQRQLSAGRNEGIPFRWGRLRWRHVRYTNIKEITWNVTVPATNKSIGPISLSGRWQWIGYSLFPHSLIFLSNSAAVPVGSSITHRSLSVLYNSPHFCVKLKKTSV